jgi:hypothetical protein
MDVTITPTPGSLDGDATIVFDGSTLHRDNAWLTIDPGNGQPKFSLNLIRADEGIVLDVYVTGREDDTDGPVATTYAMFSDAGTEEES